MKKGLHGLDETPCNPFVPFMLSRDLPENNLPILPENNLPIVSEGRPIQSLIPEQGCLFNPSLLRGIGWGMNKRITPHLGILIIGNSLSRQLNFRIVKPTNARKIGVIISPL
jgi:hypothetical protein